MSVKKRIKPGRIEPSQDGNFIVVHFTHENTHLDDNGEPTHVDKIPDKREIAVGSSIREARAEDIPALAQDIVSKCKYITANKAHKVEEILYDLHAHGGNGSSSQLRPHSDGENLHHKQRRKDKGANNRTRSCEAAAPPHGGVAGRPRSRPPGQQRLDSPLMTAELRPADVLPSADISSLDDYADDLYEEDMGKKVMGVRRLLRLCTDGGLLQEIAGHPTLLGVLSRELRENAKRSNELAVAISGIFLCFAHFADFRAALSHHQCNEVTLRVLEFESKRRQALQDELESCRGKVDQSTLDRKERRCRSVLDRQDRLLQLCVLMLHSIAEDVGEERRLVRCRVCLLLLPLLSRDQEDLLLNTLGFLHKLVVFEENKDCIKQSPEGIRRLAELVSHSNSDIALLALRVCYNISFDVSMCSKLAGQPGFVSALVHSAQSPQLHGYALRVLYHLSMSESTRKLIGHKYPECIAFSLQAVKDCRHRRADAEAAMLCTNLALDVSCAASLVEAPQFPRTVVRAVQRGDPLLLKFLRLVASHAAVLPRFLAVMKEDKKGAPWIQDLVVLAGESSEDSDVLVEAIGLLANLDIGSPSVPWPNLCDAGLLDILHRMLTIGFFDDDVLLESVMLAGVLALDPHCAPLLAHSKVMEALPKLLTEKQEDSEIVVQLLFVIRSLLLQEDTCEVLLEQYDLPDQILDLITIPRATQGEAVAVEAAVEETLDVIVAVDSADGRRASSWAERVRALRFEAYNADWCRAMRAGEWGNHEPQAMSSSGDMQQTGSRSGWNMLGGMIDVSAGISDRCWNSTGRSQGPEGIGSRTGSTQEKHRKRDRSSSQGGKRGTLAHSQELT
eukprot:TRINITY_DN80050_c0_g1_i1.p1 TRINITY_DN80050_c0_g1~~TRINITY_DN80050_c0_g1_i1.p1  ORF type:complete len:845 (+),score=186.26 TRINITY_DN80050_c0_g1_i1:176-2710(+)